MSFKDMTFCPFYKDCSGAISCHRALTPEIKKQAGKAGMPISQFMQMPDCHNKILKKGKKK